MNREMNYWVLRVREYISLIIQFFFQMIEHYFYFSLEAMPMLSAGGQQQQQRGGGIPIYIIFLLTQLSITIIQKDQILRRGIYIFFPFSNEISPT